MLSIPVQGHSPRSVDRQLGEEVLVSSFSTASVMLAGPLGVQRPLSQLSSRSCGRVSTSPDSYPLFLAFYLFS